MRVSGISNMTIKIKQHHYPHSLLLVLLLATSGCEQSEVDVGLAVDAGIDAFKAITLTDDTVKNIATDAAEHADKQNQLAPPNSPYTKRLQGLAEQFVAAADLPGGMTFDFQVYLNPTINAFAMADGTIRFYSGLMDVMTNEELLFIMGHEMGHVIHDHSHNQLRLALAGSAVRKGAASLNNEVGEIARSQLGGLAEQLLNAQYSQKEEKEADDYGVVFLTKIGLTAEHATSALQKLASASNSHSFLSSHPHPEQRVERLQRQPDH